MQGKRVVVTGGGSGIGAACARRFAAAGAEFRQRLVLGAGRRLDGALIATSRRASGTLCGMSYPPPPAYPQQPYGAGPPPGPPPGPVRLRGRVPRLLGWIFLALAVVLFVVGGVVLATKSLGKVNGFQRVSIAQGGGTVTLNGTGKWVGYYEASNVSDSISRIPQVQLELISPSGQPVAFQPYGNRSDGKVKKLTYDYNGHKGAAAIQFDVTQAGVYQVRAQAIDTLPPGADIAFGRDIETGTVVGAILIVLGVLALIAAIVLIIVGYVKRGRHKRELQSGYYGGPPPGYYGGPPPGYGNPPGY